jgi:serine protease inhibitor
MIHRIVSHRMIAASLFVAAAGCNGSSPSEPPREPARAFTQQELRLASASEQFALTLFGSAAPAEAEPNLMLSPLSASMALGMTMNGARGTTYDQMRAALGFGTLSQAEINVAYRGLIAQLLARDPKVEFTLANSIWYERGFAVQQPFIDTVRTYFDARVTGLDFAAPSAVSTINSWASDHTGGRIRNLLQRIDPLEVMFLVNAVYFKAPWTHPFQPQATQPRPFRTLAGATVQAPTMLRDGAAPHYVGDGVQLVELPYGDTAFSMVLLAPADDAPLSSLTGRLSVARWQSWLAQLTTGRVMLLLPKFRFDYGTELSAALKQLGITDAFDPALSDFAGINPQRTDLYITRVEQKSFIDVHELGTEAAAATAVGAGVTSMPPTIAFDRPFLFAIRERSSGAILFMGRIGDPTR